MIWFILSTVLVITYIIWRCFNDDTLEEIIIFTVCVIITTFFLSCLLNEALSKGDGDFKLVESKPIHALADGINVEGGGFIFYHLDENDNYVYMIENEDGTLQKEKISAEDAKILESNDSQPLVQEYEDHPANIWLSIGGESYTQLVVPEGTVVNSYNIDLE